MNTPPNKSQSTMTWTSPDIIMRNNSNDPSDNHLKNIIPIVEEAKITLPESKPPNKLWNNPLTSTTSTISPLLTSSINNPFKWQPKWNKWSMDSKPPYSTSSPSYILSPLPSMTKSGPQGKYYSLWPLYLHYTSSTSTGTHKPTLSLT